MAKWLIQTVYIYIRSTLQWIYMHGLSIRRSASDWVEQKTANEQHYLPEQKQPTPMGMVYYLYG